jgi:ATP-dependent Zn protease
MIPMRTSTIFKSRWMALLWAAGIIWLAMDVAGHGGSKAASGAASNASSLTDDDGNPVSNEDVAAAEKALGL